MFTLKMLERIGFEPQEAKVYVALLSLGEATVTEIARDAGVVRTSCYYTLQKLSEQGVVSSYKKGKAYYWSAEGPRWLRNRQEEQRTALTAIMPELLALQQTSNEKPMFKYYEGLARVKEVLKDILEERQDLMAMSSVEDAVALLGEHYRYFIKHRYAIGIQVSFITNRSPETIEMQKKDTQELRNTRFLPAGKSIKNITYIYGDKIAIMSLNRKLPMAATILDADIAHTHRLMFDALWEQCGRNGHKINI